MPATPPPMTTAACVSGTSTLNSGSSRRARATLIWTSSLAFCVAFSGSLACTQLAWSRMLAISKRNGLRPGLAQGVLEDGLVGARRAAGDDDAVEVVLLDRLADEREAVRGARVHRVGGERHAGQLPGVLGDALDVDDAGDVAAAVADEDADARLHADHVLLGRVLLVDGERAARVGEAGHDLRRGGRGLGDAVGDVLGLAERADDEHALAAGLERVELVQLAEAVAVEGDADVAGRLLRLARRLQAGREHHHVVARLVQLAALVLPADQEVVGAAGLP